MKSKLVAVMLSSVLLVVLVTGTAFAGIDVVNYDDTAADGYDWFEPTGGDSLIRNGDFSLWKDGFPEFWDIWGESKSGWEDAHLAQMDYAKPNSDHENPAMGLFIRNVGGSGSYSAGASNHLEAITKSGYYWVTVHVTAWSEFVNGAYTSVAWYGIGSSSDASSVSEWRELYPDLGACPNGQEFCNHLGRYETLWIDAGSYLHIKVSHKFPEFNCWTVFGFDDVSIVPAEGSVIDDGWIADAVITWDEHAAR